MWEVWLLDPQCSYSPAQQQAARVTRPVGEALKLKGFAAMFSHGRRDILSSALMAFMNSGRFHAASRCAYSLPGLLRGERVAHLRDQGSVLWDNNTLYLWRETLWCSLGLSSNTELILPYYAYLCPCLSHSLNCEPLRTGIVWKLNA